MSHSAPRDLPPPTIGKASTETTVHPTPEEVAVLVAGHAEPFDSVDDADLAPILDRIGEARVVCIGEASHGTSEFYRLHARITQALIEEKVHPGLHLRCSGTLSAQGAPSP